MSSRYHYYGIGIRETSIYYNLVYAGKGLTRFSPKLKSEEEASYSSRNMIRKEPIQTFLEEVPDATQFNSEIGNGITKPEVQTFVNVYKCFCQQILHAAQIYDFETISSRLLRFWSELPFQNYNILLHNAVVIDLVVLCDSLLYDALLDVLLPTPCYDIEERHLLEVSNLSKQWEGWSKTSVMALPVGLVGKKLALAQQFSQTLIRQTSFIKLSRTIRGILANPQSYAPMVSDVEKVDLDSVRSQAFYSDAEHEVKDHNVNNELLRELKDLLRKAAAIENIIEWLDTVVDAKVIKPSKQNGRSLKKRAQEFLLKWSFFGARLTHNFNLNNALSFNSFHYLRMFMDEYILIAVETQFNNERRQEIRNAVAKHAKQTKSSQSTSGPSRNNYHAGSNPAANDYKTKARRESKSWDYGGWAPSNIYEPIVQKYEQPFEAYPTSHYPRDMRSGFYPCTSQESPLFSEANNVGSYHLLSGLNYSDSAKVDTYVDESGSTFAYLSTAPAGLAQSYNSPYQQENTFSTDYYGGALTSTTKQATNFNYSASSQYKANSVSEAAALYKLNKSPVTPTSSTTHRQLTTAYQAGTSSSTAEIIPVAYANKARSPYDQEHDGLGSGICYAPALSKTYPAGYNKNKSDFRASYQEYSVNTERACSSLAPDTPSGAASASQVNLNPISPQIFYEDPLSFSSAISGTSLVTPQSDLHNLNETMSTGDIVWGSVTSGSERAPNSCVVATNSNVQTFDEENLPSISSVLN